MVDTNNARFTVASTEKDSSFTFKTIITKPDDNKYHWIEDKELERILKISAPISYTIAIGCAGYLMGEIDTICQIIKKLPFSPDWSEMLHVIVISVAFGLGLATSIYSFLSKSEAKKTLKKVRCRESFEMTPVD